MYQIWMEALYPPYYEYRPPYRECWNFMTLPKFVAGHIYQMRANKSYLNTQSDWSSWDRDPTCPRCGWESEIFKHVVQCPAIAEREHDLKPRIFDIGLRLDLWKNSEKGMRLIRGFSSFIIKNRIHFQMKMEVFPFTRYAMLAS